MSESEFSVHTDVAYGVGTERVEVHAKLAPHFSRIGRPSIDPVLMIRMLIIGYVFALRSERALCCKAASLLFIA
jgi:transposase